MPLPAHLSPAIHLSHILQVQLASDLFGAALASLSRRPLGSMPDADFHQIMVLRTFVLSQPTTPCAFSESEVRAFAAMI